MNVERFECRPAARSEPVAVVTLTAGTGGWVATVQWQMPTAGAGYDLRVVPNRGQALRHGLAALVNDVRTHLAISERMGGVSAGDRQRVDAVVAWAKALVEPDLFAEVPA